LEQASSNRYRRTADSHAFAASTPDADRKDRKWGLDSMTKTVIIFAKMNPTDLRSVRQQRGWSEQEAARRLGVSQSYLSMLDGGKRRLTSRVARRAMSVFGLPPTVLPPSPPENQWGAETLAQQLAALEYPGFAYMRAHGPKRNPAEVLVGALSHDPLEARLAEDTGQEPTR